MKTFYSAVSLISLLLLSLTLPTISAAKDLYVSDKLFVPVRKGQGNQFSILHKGLPSGTRVTLIERGDVWTKISTQNGLTGWMRSQYLEEQPTAVLQLASLNKRFDKLSADYQALKQRKIALEQDYQRSQQTLSSADQQIAQTEKELDTLKNISANAVQNYDRLQSLAEQLQLLQTENDVLRAENEKLEQSERTTFFFYGALAVLLGVIIALIVPKLRGKKRNNGWVN